MVKPDLQRIGDKYAEKLEERDIELYSEPPPLEEFVAKVTGQLFLNVIRNYSTEYGGDFTRDRDRGILSPEDRDYLWGQSEYTYKQSEYKARERIRDRVRNAILDFTDLEFNLDSEDRKRIFDNFSGDISDHSVMVIQFLYGGLDSDIGFFEDIVEQAIYQSEFKESRDEELINVDVSIDIERTANMDIMKQRLEEGQPLTDREIGALVRSGELSAESLEDFIQGTEATTLERILKDRYRDATQSLGE